MIDQSKTEATAKRLVEICRTGEWDKATAELYADNIVGIEPDGANGPKRTEGIEAKKQKDVYFASQIEEYHSNTVSDPIIAGNYFSISMSMDVTMKEYGRVMMNEICLYKVNAEGKIEYEEFFYDTDSEV